MIRYAPIVHPGALVALDFLGSVAAVFTGGFFYILVRCLSGGLSLYAVLFLGLPVLGIALYAWLRRRMAAAGVPAEPYVQLFAVFAAYGAVLLFGVSEAFGVWSFAHTLASGILYFVAPIWLFLQGVLLYRLGVPTLYHRVTAGMSVGFPFVLALFTWLVMHH